MGNHLGTQSAVWTQHCLHFQHMAGSFAVARGSAPQMKSANFENMLAELIANANGVFEDIKWVTMRGQVFTLGTMSDDHLANSRHYHKHMAEVARVAPELNIAPTDCLFVQYLMERAIERRKSSLIWGDISADDFRVN